MFFVVFKKIQISVNFNGRAMRFSALESAGFGLQMFKSRFLNFDFAYEFFRKIEKMQKKNENFAKKNAVKKFTLRNSKNFSGRVVEQSLLIPMPKTELLHRQNWPRSVILNGVRYNFSWKTIKLLPMHYRTCLELHPRRKPARYWLDKWLLYIGKRHAIG